MKGNFKVVIVCLLAIVCLGLLTKEADAFSIQARYGISAIAMFGGDDSISANSMGLDVFVYEGGNLDILLGASQHSLSVSGSDHGKFDYSLKATSFDLGFRFKPTTTWRYKPYLLGGVIYFQDIRFDEVKAKAGYTLLSYSQPDNKMGYMVGVGTDIGISDRLALGVQFIGVNMPSVKVSIKDIAGADRGGDKGAGYFGINLGLRYSF